jgi:hypothetical protein
LVKFVKVKGRFMKVYALFCKVLSGLARFCYVKGRFIKVYVRYGKVW